MDETGAFDPHSSSDVLAPFSWSVPFDETLAADDVTGFIVAEAVDCAGGALRPGKSLSSSGLRSLRM